MTQKIGNAPIPLKPVKPTPLHATPTKSTTVKAAEQFETMMALQMVKSLQSSLEGGSLFGGGVSGDIYGGLAEWQLAQTLTKGSHLGLKEQILRQLPKAEEQKQ